MKQFLNKQWHLACAGLSLLAVGSWHYQSVWNVGGGRNLYDLDTRGWGSTTSQGKDMRDVTYSNYYPVSFGGNFPIGEHSTVEQYEHIEAISMAYGATYFLRINQDDVERCPQKYQIFRAIRTWEGARRANAFPRELCKLMMSPTFDWHLEANPDGESWTLQQKEGGKLLYRDSAKANPGIGLTRKNATVKIRI